jgi:hypothetical protein
MHRYLLPVLLALSILLNASTMIYAASYTFTTIDVPGATRTTALGINDREQIVGWYADASGEIHGYLLDEGQFTTIDVPGATETLAVGINLRG